MQVPVTIEQLSGNRFRAKSATLQAFSVEGESAEESLRLWRERFGAVLPAGAEVVEVQSTSSGEHPLARFAGDLKNDPLFDEWQAAIEDFRRQRDLEDQLP